MSGKVAATALRRGSILSVWAVCAVALFRVTGASAIDVGDFSFVYNLNDKTGSLACYNGSSERVVVPSSFTVDEKYKDEDGETHIRYHVIRVTSISSTAFSKVKGTLVHVSLPNTVTRLPNENTWRGTFTGYTALQSVVLSSNLATLDYSTFSGCTALERINLDNVQCLGGYVFENCGRLHEIGSLSKVKAIGPDAFKGCSALAGRIDLPAIEEIGGNAFENCSSLTSIATGAGLQKFGNTVFAGCSCLERAILDGHFALPSQTFAYCGELQTVELRGQIRFEDGYGGSAGYPFAGCVNLQEVVLGAGCTAIPPCLFENKGNLRRVVCSENLATIGNTAFSGCGSLSDISFSSFADIGARAFVNCSNLVSVETSPALHSIGGSAFERCTALEFCRLGDEVTSVGLLFNGCTALREVIFGKKLTAIPEGMFMGLGALETCIMPSVTNVGGCAFMNCANLNVSSSSMKNIAIFGAKSFMGCIGLGGELALDSAVDVGEWAFGGCSNLTSVSTGKNTRSLRRRAFENCSSLQSASLDGNGTCSVADVFYGCSELETAVLKDGISSIAWGTFAGCSKLREVTFGKGVSEVPQSAFAGLTALETCELPFVKTIGGSAFSRCSGLKNVALDSVETIYPGAFGGCESLETVTLPATLHRLGQGAFQPCVSLKTVEVQGDGKCSVEVDAFRGCTALEKCTFGDGVVSVSCPFRECPNLREVAFGAGVVDLPASIFEGKARLETCRFTAVTNIGYNVFRNCSSLKRLSPLDKIASIGSYAFFGCTELEAVNIGRSLGVLSSQAFAKCTGLKSVAIEGDGRLIIQGETFKGCTALERCEFGDGVADLEDTLYPALTQCANLREIKLGQGIRSIPQRFARDCADLEVCEFAAVTNIGREAFIKCGKLTRISALDPVELIGSDAFNGCASLTGMVDIAAIETIEAYAFNGCSKIEAVRFGERLNKIGSNAFKSCSMLKAFVFDGAPPENVDDSAFSGLMKGAFGIYPDSEMSSLSTGETPMAAPSEIAQKWKSAIQDNGLWKRLVMAANRPILTNDVYDVEAGSLRLSWKNDEAPMLPEDTGVTYEIRRGFTDDFDSAEILTNGYAELQYVDKQFDFTGGVSRIWYWVRPEFPLLKLKWSNPCRTKNRYGISIGFDAYDTDVFHNLSAHSFGDANAALVTATQCGGFIMQSAINVRASDLTNCMADYAERVKPGDIFLFFISSHGHPGKAVREIEPHIALYDGRLRYSQLCTYVNSLTDRQCRFVGMLMPCHSEAMITGGRLQTCSDVAESIGACLTANAMGGSLTSWITSCSTEQEAARLTNDPGDVGLCTRSLIVDGWGCGYADVDLWIEGSQEKVPSHRDGELNLWEIATYAQKMYVGSRERKSNMKIAGQEQLMSRIQMGAPAASARADGDLLPPENVRIDEDHRGKIICWSPVNGAHWYRVWKYISSPTEMLAVNPYATSTASYDWFQPRSGENEGTIFPYDRLNFRNPFKYCVQAVNPAGISRASGCVPDETDERRNMPETQFEELTRVLVNIGFDVEKATPEELTEVLTADLDGDGHSVVEEFITGASPLEATSQFIANITMENGKPKVSPNPDLGATRKYTTYGKKSLADTEAGWVDMSTVGEEERSEYRFFKVAVSLP